MSSNTNIAAGDSSDTRASPTPVITPPVTSDAPPPSLHQAGFQQQTQTNAFIMSREKLPVWRAGVRGIRWSRLTVFSEAGPDSEAAVASEQVFSRPCRCPLRQV
ncbi:hypothetical protein AAFF_G00087220 [Aldrovandia affinis]|uniref:Uncharacterized protein n=1 Tax=Aldrovandia affinis TaxID=143900 RepID=A0AAD7RZ03_9TELE|nr:hypothetical protein AAFF_G00087220 [Aldrovandia affinis]